MSKAPAKAGDSASNFRARRLSVSDVDKSLPEVTPKGEGGTPTRRPRRMSMSPEMGVKKAAATLPFPLDAVGTYSCHGVEPGMRQGETSAKINQDRGCVIYPFRDDTPNLSMAVFCVFDGHGANGDKVSHFVMNTLQEKLEEHKDLEANIPKALKETFVSTDEALKKHQIDAELSGTTAVVCVVVVDVAAKAMKIFTANVGDSRATLYRSKKAYDMSEDQKPDTRAENARILKAGGFVSPPEEEWGGPARVWLDSGMTLPGLAMARSIGDHLVKKVGVIAEPEVTETDINLDTDQYFVMASDGVWEFIESQGACDIVNGLIGTNATEACTQLIETAAAKWRQEEGDYRDDITAICVKVKPVFDEMMKKACA